MDRPGIGIGNLFGYLTNDSHYPYSKDIRSSPNFTYWQEAITFYNGDSGYLDSIMSIWTTGVYIWKDLDTGERRTARVWH